MISLVTTLLASVMVMVAPGSGVVPPALLESVPATRQRGAPVPVWHDRQAAPAL
jgi:hypothetical protein